MRALASRIASIGWVALLSLAGCDASVAVAVPSAGRLDESFGTGGKATVALGGSWGRADGVAIQPDGRIVAAGVSRTETGDGYDLEFALVRLRPDGTLDASFGAQGIVTTAFGPATLDRASGVAIQPDGRIVAVGTSEPAPYALGNPSVFALARYDADGNLDATFGTGGKVTTAIGIGRDVAAAVVVQPDGKIVVAGSSDGVFAVARYRSDGSLDPAFGSAGVATASFASAASAVALQTDGKIVVAGTGPAGGLQAFAIARFDPGGVLDATFGAAGQVTTSLFPGTVHAAEASAVAVQPDGKIVAAGSLWFPKSGTLWALVRYARDGTIDPTFGAEGFVTIGISGDVWPNVPSDYARAIANHPDGGFVVAGSAASSIALARFAADGRLDLAFGDGGLVTTPIGDDAGAWALSVQADGKIVVAGESDRSPVIVRYLP